MNLTLVCILIALLAVALSAGIAFIAARYSENGYWFPKPWLVVAVALFVAAFVAPLSAHVGTNVAIGSETQYNQFLNGYETAANVSVDNCTEDGSCQHAYDCDPYEVDETYTSTDSNGNITTHTETETKYHSCPEATQEFNYTINTTLGVFEVDPAAFSANPKAWRGGHGLDGGVQRGDPALWTTAKNRIAAGDPGPVTKNGTYANYVLASQNTLLHKYSDAIKSYKTKNLLPAPAGPIHDLYQADKVTFVGYKPTDPQAWQDALSRLNAAAGMTLQGDVHLVLIGANAITDPDDYTEALSAYWQSKAFGKNDLSKNGIGVMVGIDGDKVSWARAFTGMPLGNSFCCVHLLDDVT